MTKEELIKKIKEINEAYSPEERIALLEEIRDILKEANQDLRDLHIETKTQIIKEM